MLRQHAHKATTVAAAGLATAPDDVVSVFADDRNGVLVTHDRELISRRRENTFGRHIHLVCNEWDAADVLCEHLPDVLQQLTHREAVVLKVSKDGVTPYPARWK